MRYFKVRNKNEKMSYVIIWTIICIVWIVVFAITFYSTLYIQWDSTNRSSKPELAKALLILNFIFMVLVYWSSTVDIVYYFSYFSFFKNNLKLKNIKYLTVKDENIINHKYKVYLLYCTMDDFDKGSLYKSMRQKYRNCETFILDDSKKQESKDEIDEFAKKHNVKVIRRNNHDGYKAGNVNNFLKNNKNYDYFVLLDADEIIPNDFVEKALKYFTNKEIGIVQAKNFCTRQKNLFDLFGSYLHNIQWQVEFNVRDSVGLINLSGHGAMVSKQCYEKANGFPEILLEDWALTFISFSNGFVTVYANDIVCEEEFPNNYIDFKKRQFRWTRGSVELFRKFSWNVIKEKDIQIFRKLDVFYRQSTVILNILSMTFLLVNLSILTPLGLELETVWFYVVLMLAFPITHVLKIFIFYIGKMNIFKLIGLIIFSYFLYSSLLLSSTIAAISGFIGKKFNFFVTPKGSSKKFSFLEVLNQNKWELILATILTLAIILMTVFIPSLSIFAFIWAFLTIIPLYLSVVFTVISNKEISSKQKEKILQDNKNKSIYI